MKWCRCGPLDFVKMEFSCIKLSTPATTFNCWKNRQNYPNFFFSFYSSPNILNYILRRIKISTIYKNALIFPLNNNYFKKISNLLIQWLLFLCEANDFCANDNIILTVLSIMIRFWQHSRRMLKEANFWGASKQKIVSIFNARKLSIYQNRF